MNYFGFNKTVFLTKMHVDKKGPTTLFYKRDIETLIKEVPQF